MPKKWSEVGSISTANDTHEFIIIEGGFSNRISKLNFLKELVAKNVSQDDTVTLLTSNVSTNTNNITINSGKITALEDKSVFTSEFTATDPDTLTTEGSYVNTHINLPFDLENAVISVIVDKFTGKLWQFVKPIEDELAEGYRIQDTTVGTWLAWEETNPKLPSEFIGISLATSQQPATTDTAIQVEFGVAQTGTHGHADLAVDGTVTFNRAGKYRLSFNAHFGRLGSVGSSLLFGRFLHNGVQYGSTMHAKLDDSDVLRPYSNTFSIVVQAGDILTMEIYRDSGGSDSGGLFSSQPALTGGNLSPSASLSVTKV